MIELRVLTPAGWLLLVQVVDGKPMIPPEPAPAAPPSLGSGAPPPGI